MKRLPEWLRRRPLLWLTLLVEFLLFSGPFVLVQLHQWWCAWRGVDAPAHYAFVAWMILAGVLLLGVLIVYDTACRIRRLFRPQ